MDLTGRSPRELLKLYVAVMDRLREMHVVRSANQPVGDVAELLVAQAYGVQLERQATRGYDLVVPDSNFPNGRRIEVKARRVSPGVKASHYSFLRGLDADPPPFDTLAVVHFNDDFDVAGAWEIPIAYVRERVGKLNARTGGQRLALVKPQDLADPRVRELKLPGLDSVDLAKLIPAAQPGELTLKMKRLLPAAPSVVFGAFSTSGELAKWWGPEGFTTPSLEFDPRVGHSYRIEMQPPEGDPFYLTGEFREFDPPARLAYTFVWEDPDPDDVETLVELSLRDLGESTEVVFAQGPFKTQARRELHRNGWADSFDKLEQFISQA